MSQWDWWHLWSTGIQVPSPGLAQWAKDLALPELRLQLRSQLQLGSDPWPGNSICHGAAKKEKKKKEYYSKKTQVTCLSSQNQDKIHLIYGSKIFLLEHL